MNEESSPTSLNVYHICRRTDWESCIEDCEYQPPKIDRADGFLHLSTALQIVESAARHRAGQSGLILLEIDTSNLGAELRWEASRNGELFPHLYGPIPLGAVTAVDDLPVGADGLHKFPKIFRQT